MRLKLYKAPKISLCRKCHGTGLCEDDGTVTVDRCPQCDGTGRVTVSAVIDYEIRPYIPEN